MEAPTRTSTPPSPATSPRSRRHFDPTRLFAERDRLPWFWFLVAALVSVGAAWDRHRLIAHFKEREHVVIIDPAHTFYRSVLLRFGEARDLHVQQAELATLAFLQRNPRDFDHPDLLRQMFLEPALAKATDQRTQEASRMTVTGWMTSSPTESVKSTGDNLRRLVRLPNHCSSVLSALS